MSSALIPVLMCGGVGTRLWPVSRESMPKQFVPLIGPGSTFQQVLARISDPELFARPIIITNAEFRFVVAEQLRERNIEADIVLEPMRRDSGPAVAVAAALALERDLDFLRLAAEPFARAPKKSIDYAVMERTKRAAVIPADLGWSDIGSWSAVWDMLAHDAEGNAIDGPVVMLDSRNCLVRSEDP